jgi:hypothetical protein
VHSPTDSIIIEDDPYCKGATRWYDRDLGEIHMNKSEYYKVLGNTEFQRRDFSVSGGVKKPRAFCNDASCWQLPLTRMQSSRQDSLSSDHYIRIPLLPAYDRPNLVVEAIATTHSELTLMSKTLFRQTSVFKNESESSHSSESPDCICN